MLRLSILSLAFIFIILGAANAAQDNQELDIFIDIYPHNQEYSNECNKFTLTVTNESGAERHYTAGLLKISIPIDREKIASVSWARTENSEFVLDPISIHNIQSRSVSFRFRKFNDTVVDLKRDAIKLAHEGRFKDTEKNINALFIYYNTHGGGHEIIIPAINEIIVNLHSQRFGPLSQCDDYVLVQRRTIRRLLDYIIWHKTFESHRHLMGLLGNWNAFAKSTYSKKREDWPDRSLSSITSPEVSFLERDEYRDALVEDIILIKGIFGSDDAEQKIEKELLAPARGMADDRGLHLHIYHAERIFRILAVEPERIKMNELAKSLDALQRLSSEVHFRRQR
ncbi:hypothetical protein dsat_2130 [Alkalidesulfovibrio alkalitolerans DSM 16529]|uniref:Uncharacterized protein n=1 Tax=Alkalidesulfovibrio alkalitolerans DSM 16529 TaxID=1121439 RepID=S7UN55_9BACT|nr:hypothetical protein [Alkalidesulfovibrio alkalitolerans]EPR35429.1 hypothetical protein dsat_2130 [Alkalidesulfovibrio alkalitolerans DSM 16529]